MTPWYIWKLRLELWRLSRAYPGDSRCFSVKIRKHRAVRHSASIFVPEFWEYVNLIHIPTGDGEIRRFLGLGAVKTTAFFDAYLLAREQTVQTAETGFDSESARATARLGRQ
jgi:hypothetical protein